MTVEAPLARVEQGALRGVWRDGVAAFRGVPYAEAPIRFRASRGAASWAGVRDATRHGPVAPQGPQRLARVMGGFDRPQDEACLSLTVSTPAPDAGRRPVVVFLHGGAYLGGAGSLDWYDGARLAREGVVCVGVNYRLGALGFLHHPVLSDPDGESPGIGDIRAALAWTGRNIGAFGGDPGRVTLVGQSAGAHAIMVLLASRKARGLFRRAILQSAPAGLPPAHPEAATAEAVCAGLGMGIEDVSKLADATAVPHPALVSAQTAVVRQHARPGSLTLPFRPVMPGFSDAEAFIAAAAAGAGEDAVDLIVGTNADEGHAFHVADGAGPDAAAVASVIRGLTGDPDAPAAYAGRRPGAGPAELLGDLMTERDFRDPSMRFAAAARASGAAVFAYRFDHAPPGSPLRACHCLELPFVFGTWDAWADAPMLAGGDPARMEALGAAMRAHWLAFAHDGSPAFAERLWPTLEDAGGPVLRFDDRIECMRDLFHRR